MREIKKIQEYQLQNDKKYDKPALQLQTSSSIKRNDDSPSSSCGKQAKTAALRETKIKKLNFCGNGNDNGKER